MSALETVAEPTHRLDRVAGFTELRSQALHVHVDGASLDIGRGIPDRLEQMRSTLHAPPALGKNEQQFVLRRREVDQPVLDRHAMLGAIYSNWPNSKDISWPDAAGAETAQDGADAEHELLRAERLGEVIVRAEREATNAILLFAARREHEHRDIARCRIGAKLIEDVIARGARQHEIEDDERRALLSSGDQGVRPGRRGGDAVARLHEVVGDEGDDVRLVIDDEHALAGTSIR